VDAGPDGANAVVVRHALTGARPDLWWTRLFGPGRALDPDRDFVICSNILGSCYGTTGPTSIDPASGEPWHGTFPAITVRDMVRVQHALGERLGVRKVKLVMGGSLGGMQTLEWGLMYPELVEAMVFIASTARHSAWAIGLGEAQRQAIAADPRWRDGRYPEADPPAAGLAAARAMAMLSYRSFPSFEERFARRTQSADVYAVESYLRYQGRQLVDRFDPATYATLTRAMDTHDVSRGRGDFDEVLRGVRQPTLVVSSTPTSLLAGRAARGGAPHPGARLADGLGARARRLIDMDRLNDMVSDRGRPRVEAAGDAVERAYAEKGLSLLVLGKGKVGGELLDQLQAQGPGLERDYDVVLRVAGLADRRAALFEERGVDLLRWREALGAAPETGPLDGASAPALLDRLARLPRPVLVDLTAADGMEEVYEQAFRRGIDVVGANKRPLAVPGRRLQALREARRQHHRRFSYDAAVGAALPVIDTLRKLIQAGDRVVRIEGSLSGTLGYLCAELQKGVPLSMALLGGRPHSETPATTSRLDSPQGFISRKAG
jgi:homoserine O-acetyltransferase